MVEYIHDNDGPVHISRVLPVLVACDQCEGPMWKPEAGHVGQWLCAFCKGDDRDSTDG